MSNVTYAMPFPERFATAQWVLPYTVGVYMAPMMERAEAQPPPSVALYPVVVGETQDLATTDEAALVAEVLRRVLDGTLTPKSRELMELALSKCETKKRK